MGFTSLAFLVFFPIVWLVYLTLPGRFRTVWLLAASYVFLGHLWDKVSGGADRVHTGDLGGRIDTGKIWNNKWRKKS